MEGVGSVSLLFFILAPVERALFHMTQSREALMEVRDSDKEDSLHILDSAHKTVWDTMGTSTFFGNS